VHVDDVCVKVLPSVGMSEDVWLSGVFGGKSVSLECISRQSERSRADFRHFQASFEDLLLHVILDVSHVQRIRDFFGNALYKCSFYLLTYLLTLLRRLMSVRLLYFCYCIFCSFSRPYFDTDCYVF